MEHRSLAWLHLKRERNICYLVGMEQSRTYPSMRSTQQSKEAYSGTFPDRVKVLTLTRNDKTVIVYLSGNFKSISGL